jgi:hypothetical protein
MKECSSADMSGKVQHSPSGVGGIIHTHYQQLPIKDKLSRLQVQSIIQNNTFVPVVASCV